jgi:hypothetical protein
LLETRGNHTGTHCFYLCLHMGCWWRRCIACDSATLDDSRRWHHKNNGIMTNYPSFHLLAVATRTFAKPYHTARNNRRYTSCLSLALCSTRNKGVGSFCRSSPLCPSLVGTNGQQHTSLVPFVPGLWHSSGRQKNERRPPCFSYPNSHTQKK